MASSNPPPTRKRSREQLDDEDLDELTPRKVNTTTPTSTAAKKRKIMTYSTKSSSPQKTYGAAKGGLFTIPKKISRLFGYNQGGNAEDLDELSGGMDTPEVELSEVDEAIKVKKLASNGKGSARKQRDSKMSNAKSPLQPRAARDEFDISSDTDEEAEATKVLPRKKRSSNVQPSPKPAVVAEVIKRPRGRPRKSDVLKRDKIQAKQVKRDLLRQDEEESLEPPNSDKKPKKPGRPRKSLLEVPNQVQNGILTPSKKNRGLTPRKSVTFEHNDNDLDLGFKDFPGTASSKKSKGNSRFDSSPIAEESNEEGEDKEDDEVDEAACSICSKLHTRKGNQILFCDGCDKAVHQKCYGVTDIPEGDWFCKDCLPEDDPEVDLIDMKPRGPLTDIPGFEGHLKSLQRVLLDRMTGQKHIKLRGHDEQMQKVYQVVEQTVVAGEGNSMLIIGGRGCGKTTVSTATPSFGIF